MGDGRVAIACAMSGCQGKPAGAYTWGMYPHGDRNKDVPLCRSCAADLWERSKGLVSLGRMHFEIREVPGA